MYFLVLFLDEKADRDSLVAKFFAKNGFRFSRSEREGIVKK